MGGLVGGCCTILMTRNARARGSPSLVRPSNRLLSLAHPSTSHRPQPRRGHVQYRRKIPVFIQAPAQKALTHSLSMFCRLRMRIRKYTLARAEQKVCTQFIIYEAKKYAHHFHLVVLSGCTLSVWCLCVRVLFATHINFMRHSERYEKRARF